MTDRSTGLAHRGLVAQLSSKNNIVARNNVEARSNFNQLTFHTLIDLFPDVLTNHQELRDNLNFHYDTEGFSLLTFVDGVVFVAFGTLH